MAEVSRRPRAEYLFGHGHQLELARLRALEQVADPRSREVLGRVGVGPGWSCVDVGAGAGSLAGWLARRVGPGGAAVAAELNPALLDADPPAGVVVCRHDITAGPVPPGEFDLVHTRFLLEWLPDPRAALTHLVASARPGGVVVVTDFDWGHRIPDTGPAELEAVLHAVPAAMAAVSGYQPNLGRGLHQRLGAVGVAVAECTAHQLVMTGGSPAARFTSLGLQRLRPALARVGVHSGDLDVALELLCDPDTSL